MLSGIWWPLNWPKGPEQDILIEIEHAHTERNVLFSLRIKHWLKNKHWEEGRNSAWFHQQAVSRGLEFCHLLLTSCRNDCERELFCPSELQVSSSQLLHQSDPLIGVSSMVLFFFSFTSYCASRTDFWSTAVSICFSLKSTLYVSPKISNWGHPLTFISEDITEAMKPWLAAHSQGQPWKM